MRDCGSGVSRVVDAPLCRVFRWASLLSRAAWTRRASSHASFLVSRVVRRARVTSCALRGGLRVSCFDDPVVRASFCFACRVVARVMFRCARRVLSSTSCACFDARRVLLRASRVCRGCCGVGCVERSNGPAGGARLRVDGGRTGRSTGWRTGLCASADGSPRRALGSTFVRTRRAPAHALAARSCSLCVLSSCACRANRSAPSGRAGEPRERVPGRTSSKTRTRRHHERDRPVASAAPLPSTAPDVRDSLSPSPPPLSIPHPTPH